MSGPVAVDELDRNSPPYERYATRLRSLLATDDRIDRARDRWERSFRASHGEVLDAVDADRLFVDATYYDFLVDRLLAATERAHGLTVVNPDPRDDEALGVGHRSLHDRVLDGASGLAPFADLDAEELSALDIDVLRRLYEGVVSRDRRLALGEYYTPTGVAQLAVSELATADPATDRFLDPGCGSGVFLAACIDHKRRALSDRPPSAVVSAVTDTVFGIDRNPVAAKSAKVAFLLALSPVLSRADVDAVELPVAVGDSLGLTGDPPPIPGVGPSPSVDHLVGNPPWITWGTLPETVRDQWRDTHVADLELFPHEGVQARLGHGNDDVSVPFLWVCLDRYLAAGGDAAVVLKRGLTKGPAGRLFRSLTVGDRPLSLRQVHDFGSLRPFVGVDAGVAVYSLAADQDHDFPAPTTVWTRLPDAGTEPTFSTLSAMERTLSSERTGLVPVDDDPGADWIREDAERAALGDCSHRIRHGLKDDAKAVFSLDRDQLSAVDPEHVYPYLRSRHVVKYGLFGHDLHLVPLRSAGEDNADELAADSPRTYDYLDDHRERLSERSSAWIDEGGTFYDLFGLGEYTWADYKVVWCRLGFKPHFSVVSTVDDPDLGEKPVVPGDHCMFLSTDDRRTAHFLCALLNAAPYQRCLADVAGDGKAGLSKSVVSKLYLPPYPGTETAERLAELSMDAHEVVPEHTDRSKREFNRTTIDELAPIQAEIDRLAEELLASR